MSRKSSRPRLDEILISDGSVSEEKVQQALAWQKLHGGKLGSLLLRQGDIDESELVKALAEQSGCDGVVLSDRDLAEDVVRMLPEPIAAARHVIPFDYDSENNILKIACENPDDETLARELEFVSDGKQVRLYVAAEAAINTALARYHGSGERRPDIEASQVSIDSHSAIAQDPSDHDDSLAIPAQGVRPSVCFVTDDDLSIASLRSLFKRDGYRIDIRASSDIGLTDTVDPHCQAVFINCAIGADHLRFVERVRRIAPQAQIRFYSSPVELLVRPLASREPSELLVGNLELFSSLLTINEGLPFNRGSSIGRYAERLCLRMGLNDVDSLMITNAAYVHDLARYYYNSRDDGDIQRLVRMTIRLLASLNYSDDVVAVLRSMFANISGLHTTRIPMAVLGGNILTVIDAYCSAVGQGARMSLDRFDTVQRMLRDGAGTLYIPEVVEAFIAMVHADLLRPRSDRRLSQVMIYSEDSEWESSLETTLRDEGFQSISQDSIESMIALIHRRTPDVLILALPGSRSVVQSMVSQLASAGIDFTELTTFLVVDSAVMAELTELYDKGIEDMIAFDEGFEFIKGKLNRLTTMLESASRSNSDSSDGDEGARGRLVDMSLVDLLQVLGSARKTVRIVVEPASDDHTTLRIYLCDGAICHARSGTFSGAEAIYEGLAWSDGIWRIEPIDSNDIPPANNKLSNESILMEGCRILDERMRTGTLSASK